MAEVTSRELQARVGAFLTHEPQPIPADSVRECAVEVLTRTVRRGWRTYLVGGFLRDVIVHQHSRWPRDFDMVVEGCSRDELREVFVDIASGHNRFGGLTLRGHAPVEHECAGARRLDFDVWRLEDTWAVRRLDLPCTIESFVRTPFLNIDSVAISIGPGEDHLAVFEHGFFDAFKRGHVEVNQTSNPYPVLCAARGLIMAASLNFVVGPRLAAFVYELAASVGPEEFVAAQVGHYGHVRSSRDQLARWISEVRKQLEAGQENIRLASEKHMGRQHENLFPVEPDS